MAQVRKRLTALARERHEDTHWVMTRYARDRLLHRLTQSPHGGRFVLKGATLFALWDEDLYRPTRDIDLLAQMPNDVAALEGLFRSVCRVEVEDDGLQFDPESVAAQRIIEEGQYEGVRVSLRARLGKAKLFLQVDIGFGDKVVPDPEVAELPPVLDGLPPVRIAVYPKAAVVAEKFQIAVSMGMPNSRMKDFYDLFNMAKRCEFDGQQLCDSIRATFETRGTAVPENTPVALSKEFANDETKNTQWAAFFRKADAPMDMAALSDVVRTVERFLMPPAQAAARGGPFEKTWEPGGPWKYEKQ